MVNKKGLTDLSAISRYECTYFEVEYFQLRHHTKHLKMLFVRTLEKNFDFLTCLPHDWFLV